ncbi:Mitogen-activated protein kinase cpk1 [Naganishia friedmannii]|uniref:Mitogen-activated protein kinase cpk1 n=1 Tax=Naganishia friedmannii TaxID=89922 RepID=A0ACC2VIV7_9TREE|nr:Mitogen-activated protein kinase cpk1 [Naganishia friedmannii]
MEHFNVAPYYKCIDVIGEGAYGVVVSATHQPSGTKVAIKRITPFDHAMFCTRTLREIKLLRHFRHENIIAILDIIRPQNYEDFKEVYLIQELMETDLHRVIRTQELSDDHCQYFIYQTVRGLKALHTAEILHRDLKPSNLLLNANCDLKICDFGLARSSAHPPPDASGGQGQGQAYMTEYVATRWYRAPEVMLFNGRPLFPGRELSLILDVVGTPSMDDFDEITSARSKFAALFHHKKDYLRQLPFRMQRNFKEICPKATPNAVDFIKKCLTFSPTKRMTVQQALEHPYLEPYHDDQDEPSADPLPPHFFDFDFVPEMQSRTVLKGTS